METHYFSPPINLAEEGKWLSAVTSFETTNSVFNITVENNAFSISKPGHWRIPNYLEEYLNDQLKNLLELKSQNDIELHVQENRKRGDKIKKTKEYFLSDFDTSRKEILKELKSVTYHDFEDLIYGMQLTYIEVWIY